MQKYNGTDTEVTIPATIEVSGETKTVNGFGNGAFENNTTIQKIHLSRNTRYNLGNRVFKGCTSLKVLNWTAASGATSTYTSDGFYLAFYSIGTSAFEGCTSMTSASFAFTNVADIGSNAFKDCTSLSTIYMYADKVGANVFNGCSALTQARFYKVSSFAEGALDGIPTNAVILVGHSYVSDELLEPVAAKIDQIKVYLNFNSTVGFIRLISAKKAFTLGYSSLTVNPTFTL